MHVDINAMKALSNPPQSDTVLVPGLVLIVSVRSRRTDLEIAHGLAHGGDDILFR